MDKIITRKPSANNPAAIPHSYAVKDALRAHEDRERDPGMLSPTAAHAGGMFQLKEDEEDDVADRRPQSSRVNKLVERYQDMGRGEDHAPGSRSPRSESPVNSDEERKETAVSVGRSESLKGRKEKSSVGSVRRTKSDVASDDALVLKALDQSAASSSSSSLSAKSESPSTSRETLHHTITQDDDSDFEVEVELPTLDTVLLQPTLKKLKPKEKKRQEVMNELFYTEKSHVRNLKVLHRVFYQPWLNDPAVPSDLVKLLFPNLEELIELHSSMNNSMKAKKPAPGETYGDVADILLDGLKGERGEKLRKSSAIFCQNQSFSGELLKSRIKKDQKLAQFLLDAESNPLCRRLKLADLLPMQFQRLTKYRLLIENLLKYTQANSEEHSRLTEALQCSKDVLNDVNKAVRDMENKHKLADIQKRMDRRPVDNSNDPNVAAFKNLDLRMKVMIYDGALTWRIARNKQIDLHVVLCEDILVLLQKQDEKLVLKCQSTTVVAGKEDTKFTHSPVIRLTNLLTRNVATDKRAIFLVSTSTAGPQIYELVASSTDERKKWFKYITEASEAFKGKDRRSTKTPHQPGANNVTDNKQKEKQKISEREPGETSADEQHKSSSVDSLENLEKVPILSTDERPDLVHPAEVVVSDPIFVQAEPVNLSPIENLKKKDEIIEQALSDKQRIVAQVLNVPPDDFQHIAEIAVDLEGEKEPKELILASILQATRLQDLVKENLKPPDKLPQEEDQEDSAPSTPKALTVSLPSGSLIRITQSLNDQLRQLLGMIAEREEERERLQRDLKAATEQLALLPDMSRSPGQSRPNSYISVASELSEADEPPNQSGDEANKALFPRSLLETANEADEEPLIIQAVEENMAEVCEEIADERADKATEIIHITVESPESSQEQDTSEEITMEMAEETPAIEPVEITNVTVVTDESTTDDVNANTDIDSCDMSVNDGEEAGVTC